MPSIKFDLTGMRFGRLVVDHLVRHPGQKAKWVCQCTCGGKTEAYASHLRAGAKVSCGCQRAEANTARNKASAKHGMWRTPEFKIWSGMLYRCGNPNGKQFHEYGARGISVCPEWRHDFAAFYAYIGPRPSPDHSVDRIDNDRGYEPGNVRWATSQEQQNNRRCTLTAVVDGQRMTAAEISAKFGLLHATVSLRIRTGKTGQALTQPPKRKASIKVRSARARRVDQGDLFGEAT